MDLTLQELFGEDASQDEQFLKIDKSNLPLLTLAENNRAEQLLVALILKALHAFEGVLVDQNQELVIDEIGQPIGFDNSNFYNLQVKFWRVQFQNSKIIHQFVVHDFQAYEAD